MTVAVLLLICLALALMVVIMFFAGSRMEFDNDERGPQ